MSLTDEPDQDVPPPEDHADLVAVYDEALAARNADRTVETIAALDAASLAVHEHRRYWRGIRAFLLAEALSTAEEG